MATKPKRVTMSSKVTKTVSKPKSVKTSSRPAAAKSKKSANQEFWLRTRFLFFVVLITAALISISVGLMSYQAGKKTGFTIRATRDTGVLFLQSLDSDGTHTAGDVVEVTLYEDSGKQEANALQAAVRYPSEKLEFVSVKTGTAFSQEAATDTSTAGLVRVARSIKPGATPVKGAKPVVTFQFKVLVDSLDPFELSIDDTVSLLVRSNDNQNILGANSITKFDL